MKEITLWVDNNQVGTNANTAFAKTLGWGWVGAPPVTLHLRLQGGCSSKSHSRLHNDCSYHDVVALHLRLLIGQFVVLHFEASEGNKHTSGHIANQRELCGYRSYRKGTKTRSCFLFLFVSRSGCSVQSSDRAGRGHYLWYWACRN